MPPELFDANISAPGVGYDGGMLDMMEDRNFVALRRPYFDKWGKPAVTINTGRYTVEKGVRTPIREHRRIVDLMNEGIIAPTFNATALRKEEWLQVDEEVLLAARLPMRAWADLVASSQLSVDGMSTMIMEHETMNDPGIAVIDMDGLGEDRNDGPQFGLQGLPLPVYHSGFFLSRRFLNISRKKGSGLDSIQMEACGRRIGEALEKVTIGVETGITYGGASTQVGGYGTGKAANRTSTVYGYLNFTERLTKTNVTAPTDGGWVPTTTVSDFLACIEQLRNNKFTGPFMVYSSGDWDRYLDGDYYYALTSGAVAPVRTLRERLMQIKDIVDIRRLEFMPDSATRFALSGTLKAPENITVANPFTLIFVQLQKNTARAVQGAPITTIQWETRGGWQINFQTYTIAAPQLRADFHGSCGILQATTS